MVYLRTASGGFVKADNIVGLAPQRGEVGEISGWTAICADGTEMALASFYAVPGRIERALPHLFPAPRPSAIQSARRGFVVPFTADAGNVSGA